MARNFTRRDRLFLDTSFAVANIATRDAHHARAVRLTAVLRAVKARFVTTRAVLFEIGNALSGARSRAAGVELLRDLEADPNLEIVPVTADLFAAALALYASRADEEWGLVDCYSFAVMAARGLTLALTADDHFRQAGFEALLGDDA